MFHAQFVSDDQSQETPLSKLMMKLLTPDNPAFANWVKIYDQWSASKCLPPLYYTCKAGLIKVTLGLLKNGVDVYTQMAGNGEHILQVALCCGQEAIAKILIENGANVNAQGGEYGDALQAASSYGHETIAKLLLEKGADVNARGGHYGNALQAASSCGHMAIAKLLLENGADVNLQGGNYGSALHAASSCGHEAIAKLLIEKENGADVNVHQTHNGNAFLARALSVFHPKKLGGHKILATHT